MSYGNAGQYGPQAVLFDLGSGVPSLLRSTAITVKTSGGATAQLFTDRTAGTAASNPVSTDASGNLSFFAAPGAYTLNYTTLAGAVSLPITVQLDPADKTPDVFGSSVYAPIVGARPVNAWVFLGDSLMLNPGPFTKSATVPFFSDCYPLHLAAQSNGRIRMVYNAGVSGNTTTQMLARFDTDVTPYAPGTVALIGGTNDMLSSFTLATTIANLKALIAKIVGIGAVPVMHTIPPYPGTTAQRTYIRQLNAWIHRYSSVQGYAVVPYFGTVVDPATGNYLATYDSGDHEHPNAAGTVAIAAAALNIVGPMLPQSAHVLLTKDNGDESNLLVGGTFLSAPTSGIAGSWVNYGNANTLGNAASITTDSNVVGSMQTITGTASTASGAIGQNVTSAKFAVGDLLSLSGIVTTTGPTYAQLKMTVNGATASATWKTVGVVTRELFYIELAVPTGATSIDVTMTLGNGTGSLSVGQFTLRNLTQQQTLT